MKPKEKKAKELYSRYVRIKGCIETTGSTEFGKCFTCGRLFSFEQLQCGHFVSGRSNALFFEPNNAHIQCSECNCDKGGNREIYREKMIKENGEAEVERLESMRHKIVKLYDSDYDEIISDVTLNLEKLNNC